VIFDSVKINTGNDRGITAHIDPDVRISLGSRANVCAGRKKTFLGQQET